MHKIAKQVCNELRSRDREPKLYRLLTQVNCCIASIARLRDGEAISTRKAEQKLRKAVELRTKLIRQIDRQNDAFDA